MYSKKSCVSHIGCDSRGVPSSVRAIGASHDNLDVGYNTDNERYVIEGSAIMARSGEVCTDK
jgi:hypothetical protein